MRGLKPGIHAVQLRFHLTVRKERIPVRGLKHFEIVGQFQFAVYGGQKGTNPREGIETF